MAPEISSFETRVRKWQRTALVLGLVGMAFAAAGFAMDRQSFAQSYLVAFLFWLGTALGCLPLIMLHHLTGGNWGFPIRRVMEIAVSTIPLLGLAFLPVAGGLQDLYLWARPEAVAHDLILQQKQLYLNPSFFCGRAVFYFVVWSLWAMALSKGSKAYDQNPSSRIQGRLQMLSGAGLVMYGLTVSFASIDWAMSLEPHWYSSIYGFMFMIGQTLAAFALVILMTRALAEEGPLTPLVNTLRIHDLGKLLFAFIMLWAYIGLSQFIIIWSGNLKEEIPWYLTRFSGGWQIPAFALAAFHFVVPFGLLLSRGLKSRLTTLAPVAGLILVMRYVDLVWLVKPAFSDTLSLTWMDAACMAAIGGLWIAWLLHRILNSSLALSHDPLLHAPQEVSHEKNS